MEGDEMTILGERIRRLRLEIEKTQKEFGALFGVANSTVSLWESGANEPDAATLARIASHFRVSVDWLVGRTDDRGQRGVDKPNLAERWPNLSPDRRQRAYQMEQAAKGMPDTYLVIPQGTTNEKFDDLMKILGTMVQLMEATKKPDHD